jgi:hypothetical protein
MRAPIPPISWLDIQPIEESLGGDMAGCEAISQEQLDAIEGWLQRAYSNAGSRRTKIAREIMMDVWRDLNRVL